MGQNIANEGIALRNYCIDDKAELRSIWIRGFGELVPQIMMQLVKNRKLIATEVLVLGVIMGLFGLTSTTVGIIAVCYFGYYVFAHFMIRRFVAKAKDWNDLIKYYDCNSIEYPGLALVVACDRKDSKRAVGMAALERMKETKQCSPSWISETACPVRVCVHESFRRYRAGALMMDAIESRARELGFKRCALYTGNPIAMKFYSRLGYVKQDIPGAGTMWVKELVFTPLSSLTAS